MHANMTDTPTAGPFRKQYRDLAPDEAQAVEAVKDAAEVLWRAYEEALETCGADARCMAVAKTNLEQSVMWATKAIT